MELFKCASLQGRTIYPLPKHTPAFICAQLLGPERANEPISAAQSELLSRVIPHVPRQDLQSVDRCAELAQFIAQVTRTGASK